MDGLHCPFSDCKMGVTGVLVPWEWVWVGLWECVVLCEAEGWCLLAAENVAKRWELSREEQDRFAAASQRKAAQAIASGAFREELVAVTVQDRKGGRTSGGNWVIMGLTEVGGKGLRKVGGRGLTEVGGRGLRKVGGRGI